ncbi:MAG: hypothetical protein ACTHOH_15270 [Lysobacteraceae bacterium]
MARLIVDAVSQESKSVHEDGYVLLLFVSVSRADTGTAVNGLGREHFRVCSPLGAVFEMNILGATELDWEPADTEAAGCYSLRVARKWAHSGELSEWNRLESTCFGVQVRVPGIDGTVDQGQTAVRIDSGGRG